MLQFSGMSFYRKVNNNSYTRIGYIDENDNFVPKNDGLDGITLKELLQIATKIQQFVDCDNQINNRNNSHV